MKALGCFGWAAVVIGLLLSIIFDNHQFMLSNGAKGCNSNPEVSYTISGPESYEFSCEKKDGKQYMQFDSGGESRIIGLVQVNIDNRKKTQLDINFDVVDVYDVVLDSMESCFLNSDPAQIVESPYILEVSSATDIEVTCTNRDKSISINAFIQLRPFSQVSN